MGSLSLPSPYIVVCHQEHSNAKHTSDICNVSATENETIRATVHVSGMP